MQVWRRRPAVQTCRPRALAAALGQGDADRDAAMARGRGTAQDVPHGGLEVPSDDHLALLEPYPARLSEPLHTDWYNTDIYLYFN